MDFDYAIDGHLLGSLAILSLQVVLGILNGVWILPLGITVAHNAVAALLLTIITLVYILYAKPTSKFN